MIVWLSGHSQAGTTLLLSLIDGHPECLVYPDEPSFSRLFDRMAGYNSAQHMHADFLFGTPEPLLCAREAGLAVNIKSDRVPAVSEPLPKDDMLARLISYAPRKRLRGLETTDTADFDQALFFSSYYSSLVSRLSEIKCVSPVETVSATFDALRSALAKTAPALSEGRAMRVFKQPRTRLRSYSMSWFTDAWPEGKVVFMTRNPFARLLSIIRHDTRFGQDEIRLNTAPRKFLRLCRSVAADYWRAKSLVSEPNFLLVDYDELTANTAVQINKICSFLGISADPILYTPTKLGFPVNTPTNRTGAGKAISSNSRDKWKSELTSGERLALSFYLKINAFEVYRFSLGRKLRFAQPRKAAIGGRR
jgi:hypothetical protein